MDIALVVLIIIVSILLTIIVLIQNSKGGGLASNVGISSNQFGVKKTSDFLEKLTWGLAIALVVLCLGVNLIIDKGGDDNEVPSSINVEKAKESKNVPGLPQKQPATPAPDASPSKPAPTTPAK